MSCVSTVSVDDSNDDSDYIEPDATADDYTSDKNVDHEVTYESEGGGSSGGGSNSVSLTNHVTSNPSVLLFGALTLVGICFLNSKK